MSSSTCAHCGTDAKPEADRVCRPCAESWAAGNLERGRGRIASLVNIPTAHEAALAVTRAARRQRRLKRGDRDARIRQAVKAGDRPALIAHREGVSERSIRRIGAEA